jgi:hypothetical protein
MPAMVGRYLRWETSPQPTTPILAWAIIALLEGYLTYRYAIRRSCLGSKLCSWPQLEGVVVVVEEEVVFHHSHDLPGVL